RCLLLFGMERVGRNNEAHSAIPPAWVCAGGHFAVGCGRFFRIENHGPHMTAHPLTALLAPASVAIFGASNDPSRISGRSLRYFREAGFTGGLYPINPTRDTVQGLTAYPDIASVPG